VSEYSVPTELPAHSYTALVPEAIFPPRFAALGMSGAADIDGAVDYPAWCVHALVYLHLATARSSFFIIWILRCVPCGLLTHVTLVGPLGPLLLFALPDLVCRLRMSPLSQSRILPVNTARVWENPPRIRVLLLFQRLSADEPASQRLALSRGHGGDTYEQGHPLAGGARAAVQQEGLRGRLGRILGFVSGVLPL